jgi:hypothetical protein
LLLAGSSHKLSQTAGQGKNLTPPQHWLPGGQAATLSLSKERVRRRQKKRTEEKDRRENTDDCFVV